MDWWAHKWPPFTFFSTNPLSPPNPPDPPTAEEELTAKQDIVLRQKSCIISRENHHQGSSAAAWGTQQACGILLPSPPPHLSSSFVSSLCITYMSHPPYFALHLHVSRTLTNIMQILSEGLSFLLAVTTMTKKHTLSLHKPRHIFACSTLNIQLQNNTHKLQIPQVKDILIFCIHTLYQRRLYQLSDWLRVNWWQLLTVLCHVPYCSQFPCLHEPHHTSHPCIHRGDHLLGHHDHHETTEENYQKSVHHKCNISRT